MKIRLFLDEDVHSGLANVLRKRGFDVVHAQNLGRKGRSDVEQLTFAIQQKRCLFSFNVKDFVVLHNQFVQNEQKHCGIIVSKQIPFSETMHKLLRLLQRFSQETMENRLEFL